MAAQTHVIEIVLRVEGGIAAATRSGIRNTVMAKKAGRLERVLDRADVGIQRRVSLIIVTFEALVGRVVRHPVAEESRVLEAVSDIWIAALERQVVTGRAGDSVAVERCTVISRDRQDANRQVRAMTTGEHAASVTVALHATDFSGRMSQGSIAPYRRCVEMAGIARRLVPVRVVAGKDLCRHENGRCQ